MKKYIDFIKKYIKEFDYISFLFECFIPMVIAFICGYLFYMYVWGV